MKRIVGSVCYFRSAMQHRKYDNWSSFARRPKYLAGKIHNCDHRVTNNAEIGRFLRPTFMVARAVTTDIAVNPIHTIGAKFFKTGKENDCGVLQLQVYTQEVGRVWGVFVESVFEQILQRRQRKRFMIASASVLYYRNANRAGPLVEYDRRIAAGDLLDGDACQLETLRELQRLYDQLVESADDCKLDRYSSSEKAGRSRWLWSRFMPQSSYSPVKGLYLYGGVGTGKTMLMDLFFGQLPSNWRKKRIHFHDFMLNVHSRLQKHKGVSDPLEVVAGEISDEAILLCLDEFMVTDVADALILNRLFKHLFGNGVILVATSNRAPDNLYEGGLQRDLFVPFIATLKERCVAQEIGSVLDYRKMTSAEQGFYFIGKDLSNLLKQKFQELSVEHAAGPQEVEVVMGRKLLVPLGANGCAYFKFEELCDRPLGAADYFGLFKTFHTLALEGVPILGLHNRTAAYRFVTLVDVMYENRARLLCTAEGSPLQLFQKIVTITDAQNIAPRTSSRSRRTDESDLCVDNELGFAKDRTISRLTEMNSKEYLEHHAAMLADKQQEQQQQQLS